MYKVYFEGCWVNEIVFVEGYDVNGVLKLIDYDEVVCLESIVESMVVFCLVCFMC